MRKYTLRLDEQHDGDVIRWLERVRAEGGYGAVSRTLRAALRLAYDHERAHRASGEGWEVDLSALLPQIRSTVEAAVMSVIGQLQLVAVPAEATDAAGSEADALLDDLSADLLLDEDEEDSHDMA